MKSLIIYFSHTGEDYMNDGIRNIDKGNTEIVAEKIKELKNTYNIDFVLGSRLNPNASDIELQEFIDNTK